MRQSCRIIRQSFAKIKPGPVRVKTPKTAPVGRAFAHVEDPRGEGLMYIISDGSGKPYRLKVRSPIFVTVSAMPVALRGRRWRMSRRSWVPWTCASARQTGDPHGSYHILHLDARPFIVDREVVQWISRSPA